MKFNLSSFLRDQLSTVPPLVKEDLTGKTIIITGANVGIGLEAAKHLARMNPGKLIVTCRNHEKAEETLTQIRKETGCETVEAWVLDLADFSSVKAFAARFEEEGGDRLDILLENAGVAPSPSDLTFTKDGWETGAQVNSMATPLLALLLLPRMLDTAERYNTTPRIVVPSSETHYNAILNQEDIDSPNFFRKWAHKDNLKQIKMRRYGETKLMSIVFVRSLNDRLHRKPLIINAPNPGLCSTSLRRKAPFPWTILIYVAGFIMHTPEEGSRFFVQAAIGSEEKKDSLRGEFLCMGEPREASDLILGEAGRKIQDKLWDDLIEELVLIEPKITQIVKNHLTEPVGH